MKPIIIGVAGGSGSGKTTVVQEIARNVSSEQVVVIQHDFYYRGYKDELGSHCGEYEGVPVNQPWRRRNNVLVIKSGFKFIKKKIIESLSDDELELFGRPPRDSKLNEPATKAKAKLVEALTKFRDGSVPNLVTTTGSAKRRD